MKLLLITTVISAVLLVGCDNQNQQKEAINASDYKVKDVASLQSRFEQLNSQFSTNFTNFKKVESLAFAQQHPLDVNDLTTLNMHLVASTALKPTKIAYCDLMNHYFVQMYRLGHFNLDLVQGVKLPNAKNENLKADFSTPEAFYDFIMNRYTTYRQVQQVMNYGCNLKGALSHSF